MCFLKNLYLLNSKLSAYLPQFWKKMPAALIFTGLVNFGYKIKESTQMRFYHQKFGVFTINQVALNYLVLRYLGLNSALASYSFSSICIHVLSACFLSLYFHFIISLQVFFGALYKLH